ncbi:hypothetical protein K456DRAFT_36422 [Colletotrichum gloeosporioides 23]|nr:hypothetical protein K456DRAFT_36422 [Colletotrichum gloeosporioides 23]
MHRGSVTPGCCSPRARITTKEGKKKLSRARRVSFSSGPKADIGSQRLHQSHLGREQWPKRVPLLCSPPTHRSPEHFPVTISARLPSRSRSLFALSLEIPGPRFQLQPAILFPSSAPRLLLLINVPVSSKWFAVNCLLLVANFPSSNSNKTTALLIFLVSCRGFAIVSVSFLVPAVSAPAPDTLHASSKQQQHPAASQQLRKPVILLHRFPSFPSAATRNQTTTRYPAVQ